MRSFTDPSITAWLDQDPPRAALVRKYGAHSLIAVPVRARGATLGAVTLIRHGGSPQRFRARHVTITDDLVTRAAIYVDNARRFTRERSVALALQRSLLPHGPAVLSAVETAARYLPTGGDAGGDWFDVIPLPGARVGLVVGDVVGHGISASATMGGLRTAVRTLADVDMPPDELLTHLDDLVLRLNREEHPEGPGEHADSGNIGATCVYAVYDPVARQCTVARAGHPAPVVMRPDGTVEVPEVRAGPPLGLGGLPFESTELDLPDGSMIALFTDGLIGAGRVDRVPEGGLASRRGAAGRGAHGRPVGVPGRHVRPRDAHPVARRPRRRRRAAPHAAPTAWTRRACRPGTCRPTRPWWPARAGSPRTGSRNGGCRR